jgi:hypothetical protein
MRGNRGAFFRTPIGAGAHRGAMQTNARAPTFGQLVRRLNESSVVVYITFGRCPGHVGACLNYQSAAAGLTYLRVTLDWFDHPPEARAGLLAHELTHALEVADARVTSLEGFRSFYERYGRHGFVGYETDEAAATGRRVELELAHELARR